MARIGFIGLGNMGLPMAQNLIKAGHQVEGVDVTQAATDKAARRRAVSSPKPRRSRLRAADVVITMLPAGRHVREVYLGRTASSKTRTPARC
jgi:3-hydroxyisobutyrate dehydrogenase